MRAVLYLRLSQSTDDSTSIARQRLDLEELASREGWEIVRELADDGISGRKVRANATEALRMLRDGEADVLAVWKFDRFSRQGIRAVGELVETLDGAPGALFVAHRDGLRSDQSAWRVIAAVLAEVARTEAENTATRIRNSVAHLRSVGRFAGGTIPFGFRPAPHPDGAGRTLLPHPPEVAIVREFAERILGGETQASMIDDLTARGVATTRSAYRLAEMRGEDPEGLDRGSWSYAGLAAVWTGDSLLGRVSRSRKLADGSKVWETVRDDDGAPLQAYPPILEASIVERLRAHLRDAKRPGQRRGKLSRKARVLSDVIFCRCGQRLWVTTSGGRTVYTCAKRAGRCNGPNMKAESAERAVEDVFLGMVGAWPEVEPVEIVSEPETAAEIRELDSAIRDESGRLADVDADEAAILRRVRALKARRADLQAVPSEVQFANVPTGRTVAEAWAASDANARRRMLLVALDHVELDFTPTKGRTGYHPERLSYFWRDAYEATAGEFMAEVRTN